MCESSRGHTVTIDDTFAVAYTIAVDGKLTFAPTVNTRLKVTNLEVMAGNMGMGTPGVLEVGTAAVPIAVNVTAEIVIADSPLGGSVPDPEQFGTGINVFGKVSMHGSVTTPTFLRLAAEPRAGNTTLTLSAPVSGWKIGDRLVLPDTRHIKESEVTGGGWVNAVNQWEERTVQGISADGKTLTLNSALQYDHLGARDLNGVLDFLPHVGNLTRNVVIRSENPSGTRGHMLGIHLADVDIRYALFKDMGRTTYLPLNTTTNHIGRYPIHVHHLSGPLPTPANGYQFTLVGNAVDGGSVETKFKWGITVHGSHYGLIQDNVVYNYNGAAVATEDGSESFNVFDHNFALRGMGEPNDSVSEARMAMGTEGVGFWFRGPEQLREKQRGGQLSESDDGSRVRIRLPVPLPWQHRGPEFQGRRYHHGHRPIDHDERQQHAAAPIREQRSVWGHAGRLHVLVDQLTGSSTLCERRGKRRQGSEAVEHLQQGGLCVSRPEDHLRRTENQRQFQLAQPVLRQRRVLRGLLFKRHRHPQFGYPGHGGWHHGPDVRLRSGTPAPYTEFISA